MGQTCRRPLQMRQSRVHAGLDSDMPANDINLTLQQQQVVIAGSNTSLQREVSQSTLTHAAAVNGDKSALSKLISNHCNDINAKDQFGRSPLTLAVLADRLECAEILIKHGAKVNSYDNAGRTTLHWAAYKGNTRLCKVLLSKGADWKIKDKEGQTALHLATRHDNTKCLMLLIKQLEPGEQDEQDNSKRTALHWSSSYGNEEAVKLLIKHNSNIGIPDTDGKTPLHWAASAGNSPSAVNTLQLILDTEPSVITWQDYDGRTALHLAVAQGNETITQQLINFQTTLVKCNVSVLDNMFRTPLHWAAVLGHTHIVNMLLDAGANVSSSDVNGATSLHYAAQNNHADTVVAFLSRENITDEPDLEGRTALMWAAGKGADAVISSMVEISHPDINATDKTGATALHAAAMCSHPSTINVLLELGAHVNILDQSKHTPLFRAAEMGHTYVVKALIQGGAQVDILDQEGRSPIHWSALGGHTCICFILIGEGINPNINDFTGRTPLQCASYGGFTNSILLLLEKEADPNSQDSEGMTALHYCCSSGYLDAAKLLLEHGAFPNHMEYSEEHLTPLDYALQNEHHHVAQYMLEQGALSITGIRDIAAIRVQAYFRGYRVRKTFVERKRLLMKHEQLRKDAAKKKEEMTKKNETEDFCRIDEVNGDDENKIDLNSDLAKADTKEKTIEDDSDSKQSTKLCWEMDSPKKAKDKIIIEDYPMDERNNWVISEVEPESRLQTKLEEDNHDIFENNQNHISPHTDQLPVQKSHFAKSPKEDLKINEDICDLSEHTEEHIVNVNENSNNNNNTDLVATVTDGVDELKIQAIELASSSETDGASSDQQRWTLDERRQIVEKERNRLAFWRKKNASAAVIQKTWRNFKQTSEWNNGTVQHPHSFQRSSKNPTEPKAHPRAHARARPMTDPGSSRCQQTVSFPLQKNGHPKLLQKLQPQFNALRQTVVLQNIYAERQGISGGWRASPSVRRTRPHYQQYVPSAAASSFNFAMDHYQPVVRRAKTPVSLRHSSHQAKNLPDYVSNNQSDGERSRSEIKRSSKSAKHYSYNHH